MAFEATEKLTGVYLTFSGTGVGADYMAFEATEKLTGMYLTIRACGREWNIYKCTYLYLKKIIRKP